MPTVTSESPLVLASSSPRRRELISLLLSPERLIIDPPAGFVEPECHDPHCLDDVEAFVGRLAGEKATAAERQRGSAVPILAADTVVVADAGKRPVVLGKPPTGDSAEEVVCGWLCDLLSSRPHHVMTGVSLRVGGREAANFVVQTEVCFTQITREMARWYFFTGEPMGKAGGYAIQGAASLFVESIKGGVSNVIGLPLWETREALRAAGYQIELQDGATFSP